MHRGKWPQIQANPVLTDVGPPPLKQRDRQVLRRGLEAGKFPGTSRNRADVLLKYLWAQASRITGYGQVEAGRNDQGGEAFAFVEWVEVEQKGGESEGEEDEETKAAVH